MSKPNEPKNIHIVRRTQIIDDDGEQTHEIKGLFANKPDTERLIKELMVDYLLFGVATHDPEDFHPDTQKIPMTVLNEAMYGPTGKWSPEGKFWERPRWTVETHKLNWVFQRSSEVQL
tara:strand:- start:1787 stop:2140 length:354 start_codon:yes stop_codon:yes gene_type:complete